MSRVVRFDPNNDPALRHYKIGKTLGEGSFAKVKLATHILTQKKVALKILDKLAITDKYVLKNMHREAEIMQRLNHPNIAKIYEVIETPDRYILVIEHCGGGEMLDYIITRDRLHEREARRFVRQIASALNHMHQKGVTHRDMKPENLLLDEQLNVKLIDFGLSNMFEGEQHNLTTRCGSFEYSAPELIGAKPYFGPEVDYYTMGVNLYAMLTGELPFQSDNISVVYRLQLREEFPIPFYLTNDCQNLIRRMLKADPRKRITPQELAEHPWIVAGGGVLVPHVEDGYLDTVDEDVAQAMLAMNMAESMEQITQSVLERRLDKTFATYRLLYPDIQRARLEMAHSEEVSMSPALQTTRPVWAGAIPNYDERCAAATSGPAPVPAMKKAYTVGVDRHQMNLDTPAEALPVFSLGLEQHTTNESAGMEALKAAQAAAAAAEQQQQHMLVAAAEAAAAESGGGIAMAVSEVEQEQAHIMDMESDVAVAATPADATTGDDGPPQFSMLGGAMLGDGAAGGTLGEGLSFGLEGGLGAVGGFGFGNSVPVEAEEAEPRGLMEMAREKEKQDNEMQQQQQQQMTSSGSSPNGSSSPASGPGNGTARKGKTGLFSNLLDKMPGGIARVMGMKRAATIEVDFSSRVLPIDRGRFDAAQNQQQSMQGMDSGESSARNSPTLDESAAAASGKSKRNKKEKKEKGPTQKLQSARFALSCQTISAEKPAVILDAVKAALASNDVAFSPVADNEFMLSCTDKRMRFEVEVCKIPGLRDMNGVRFNRIAGEMWYYKDRSRKIVNSMKL